MSLVKSYYSATNRELGYQWRVSYGTRPHFPGEKTWSYTKNFPGTPAGKREAEKHDAEVREQMSAGQLPGGERRQRFRPSIMTGFEGIGGGIIQAEPKSSREARQKKKKTATFIVYEMVAKDRIKGGPSRVVVGYSYNPKSRATDYMQLGFDVELINAQRYVGDRAAYDAETKLINSYARNPAYKQIAQEVFIEV